jgi:hypothetical protein
MLGFGMPGPDTLAVPVTGTGQPENFVERKSQSGCQHLHLLHSFCLSGVVLIVW